MSQSVNIGYRFLLKFDLLVHKINIMSLTALNCSTIERVYVTRHMYMYRPIIKCYYGKPKPENEKFASERSKKRKQSDG